MDSLEIVAITKFTPLDAMRKSGKYDNIKALKIQLVSISKTSRKIEINRAHEGGIGDMWIWGGREVVILTTPLDYMY